MLRQALCIPIVMLLWRAHRCGEEQQQQQAMTDCAVNETISICPSPVLVTDKTTTTKITITCRPFNNKSKYVQINRLDLDSPKAVELVHAIRGHTDPTVSEKLDPAYRNSLAATCGKPFSLFLEMSGVTCQASKVRYQCETQWLDRQRYYERKDDASFTLLVGRPKLTAKSSLKAEYNQTESLTLTCSIGVSGVDADTSAVDWKWEAKDDDKPWQSLPASCSNHGDVEPPPVTSDGCDTETAECEQIFALSEAKGCTKSYRCFVFTDRTGKKTSHDIQVSIQPGSGACSSKVINPKKNQKASSDSTLVIIMCIVAGVLFTVILITMTVVHGWCRRRKAKQPPKQVIRLTLTGPDPRGPEYAASEGSSCSTEQDSHLQSLAKPIVAEVEDSVPGSEVIETDYKSSAVLSEVTSLDSSEGAPSEAVTDVSGSTDI